MATKSILKNVTVKDNQTAKKLANALEQSGHSRLDYNQAKAHYSYASPEDVRKMFGQVEK